MRKVQVGILAFLGLALTFAGCQVSSESTGDGVSDLGSLPKATSPVGAASATNLRSRSQLMSASTGVKVRSAHSTTWTGKSRAMCESSRLVRDAYLHASTPDAMLCVIGALADNGQFSTTVTDGNNKQFHFGGDLGEIRLRLNATKSSGNIANFNLYICKSDGTNYSQVGYVGHDLTSNKAVAMTSVFNATVGSNTVGARSSISGAVSKAGAWTSKTIQSITSTTLSSGTFDSKSTITQSSDKLEIDSFQKGTYSSTAFTNRVHAIMELLGGDTLINFAVGDGSARYVLSGLASLDNTTSWTGDDKAPLGTASNGTYYSSVAGTTPKATETVSTAFSEAETWDCAAGTGGSFSEIAITTSLSTGLIEDFAACVTNFPDPVDTFVDCAGTLDN